MTLSGSSGKIMFVLNIFSKLFWLIYYHVIYILVYFCLKNNILQWDIILICWYFQYMIVEGRWKRTLHVYWNCRTFGANSQRISHLSVRTMWFKKHRISVMLRCETKKRSQHIYKIKIKCLEWLGSIIKCHTRYFYSKFFNLWHALWLILRLCIIRQWSIPPESLFSRH